MKPRSGAGQPCLKQANVASQLERMRANPEASVHAFRRCRMQASVQAGVLASLHACVQ